MSDGRKTVLLIAGEASGDTLGAELIKAMRAEPGGDDLENGIAGAVRHVLPRRVTAERGARRRHLQHAGPSFCQRR